MAGYSARQSSFTTGDTITSAHSNDEFNQVLAAFHATTGHTHDGTAGEGGPISTLRDADANNKVLVDTTNNHLEFYVEVSSAAVQQFRIQDGAIVPITDNDIDLGTSSLEFKDLYIDGTAHVDAINFNGTAISATAAELNIMDGVTSTAAELNILDGVTSTAAELNILDGVTSTAAELNILDGVTSTAAELNTLDGVTAVVGELNALDLGSTAIGTAIASKAVILDANKDYTGIRNLTISGDLTVSGDDITMGTNTAGNLLVADGTNFNSIAAGSLSEISTVANDDVFIAVDTSGGGLKKIARSAIVAGLATSSAISNVVEDTSPQLGGNLDMNGADIVTTSNATIDLAPNGTGTVVVRGNTNSGAIVFNCESNSHGQKVIAQAHSAGVTNTLTLPAGASSTLVSLVSTDTLTNKTLTSPKINEDVAVTSTATEINVLDGITAVVGELNALDIGSTAVGTAVASKAVILDSNKDYTGIRNFTISGEIDAATGDFSGAVDVAGATTTAAITASGIVKTDDTTEATSTTDGSLQTDGGLSVAKDAVIGDDLKLLSDSAVLSFGADSDTTLTHTDGTGLTLNSTNKLCFNDASQFIQGASATVLDIAATDEIELTATLIDVVGALTSSGIITANAKLDLNGTELILDADADTSITADTDDQIDIRLAGADDFTITANTFTILSGSTIAIAAGGGITNAGSMSSDITSTGKALVFGF